MSPAPAVRGAQVSAGRLRRARSAGAARAHRKKSPGFGAFSSSPYTVPLCWVWGFSSISS